MCDGCGGNLTRGSFLKSIVVSYMIPVDVVPRVSAGRLVIGI